MQWGVTDMSIVYAEGFNRARLGAIGIGNGIMGKACDIRVVTNASFPVSIVTRGSRRWITTPNPTFVQEQPQVSPSYLSVQPWSPVVNEAARATPGMPPYNQGGVGVGRVIVTWKVDATGQALLTGNSNYFCSIGSTVFSNSLPTTAAAALPYIGKGYFPLELEYNRNTRKGKLWCNGLLVNERDITGSDEIRLNLVGIRTIPGGVLKGGQTWITDVVVVYDDGISPSRRIGDVTVAEVGLDQVTPTHPDVKTVGPSDVSDVGIDAGTPNIQITGDGTVDVYKVQEALPYLSAGKILAATVDINRQADSPIPGDLETKIETPLGSSVKLESPTTLNINLESTIRNFTKPITVGALKADVKVKFTTKSR